MSPMPMSEEELILRLVEIAHSGRGGPVTAYLVVTGPEDDPDVLSAHGTIEEARAVATPEQRVMPHEVKFTGAPS